MDLSLVLQTRAEDQFNSHMSLLMTDLLTKQISEVSLKVMVLVEGLPSLEEWGR